MVCFNPLKGWWSIKKNVNTGNRYPVFDKAKGHPFMPVSVACGQCLSCRISYSKSWATRISHESDSFDSNCFVTLTYRDECLPSNRTLVKEDFQNFMKRLRKEISPTKIRYFHCGEYSEENQRPHYHACIFNYDFPDKEYFGKKLGNVLYTSKMLYDEDNIKASIWKKGYCIIGNVSFDSAAYVARYILKKVTGKKSDEHYVNKETGELRQQEYTTMSRRPGLGNAWIKKHMSDVYPNDTVIIKGRPLRPPKYYDNIFDVEVPEMLKHIKEERKKFALAHDYDNTRERLASKEICLKAKLQLLKRSVE